MRLHRETFPTPLEEVMKLVNNEFKQPGRYTVDFNGTNLASGVYFYK